MLRALLPLASLGTLVALFGLTLPAAAQMDGKNSLESPPIGDSLLSNREHGKLRGDQTIERLQYEDSAATISELRVGGQSRAISVQPKLPLPAWQVLQGEGARGSGGGSGNAADAAGKPRVWNILNF